MFFGIKQMIPLFVNEVFFEFMIFNSQFVMNHFSIFFEKHLEQILEFLKTGKQQNHQLFDYETYITQIKANNTTYNNSTKHNTEN